MSVEESYIKRRQEFFDQYGYLWPRTLHEPTDILDAIPIKPQDFRRIRNAACAIAEIYKSFLRCLADVPRETLHKIGIPPDIIIASQCETGVDDLAVGRLDLVVSKSDIKVLECNWGTPGLIVETFEINRLICEQLNRINPNEAGYIALIRTFLRNIEIACQYLGKSRVECNLAVCYRAEYSRDIDAARYLTKRLGASLPRIHEVALEECTIDENGVYDLEGNRVDVIILMYPLHDLSKWRFVMRGEKGRIRGIDVGALCAQRKLAVINTPVAALLENKAVQALIWLMNEEGIGFSRRTRSNIRKFMLPTAFQPTGFAERFVAKPAWSGGGKGIQVFHKGKLIERSRTSELEKGVYIYQEYCDIPQVRTMTEYGVKELRFIASVWLIGGRHIGLCYRAGEGITDAAWWVVPVYLED
jgi:glutathionylspermidine synthase